MDDMQRQLRKIEKRLDRAARFGSIQHKELKKVNRKAARVYVPIQRAEITNYPEDIIIKRRKKGGGTTKTIVRSGQLKASIGVWFSKGSNTAIAGPRVNPGGNKRFKRKVRESADGWFAHIVEMGARPSQMEKGMIPGRRGARLKTKNTGAFKRGLTLAQPAVKKAQVSLYRSEFKRYMK
jgi:hypothetical protein